MKQDDFACWGGKNLMILSEDDTTFTAACREDLITLMPTPIVVTDLTGGHLALVVWLEQYAGLVTEYVCAPITYSSDCKNQCKNREGSWHKIGQRSFF